MRIEDWMTRSVHVVRPRDSILHARELMEKHRVNQLPVVVDKRVLGIVTDRDLRDAFPSSLASEWGAPRKEKRPVSVDPREVSVETVMTPNVFTLPPAGSLVAAAQLMQRERIGAVPIVDNQRLVGILTRCDLLKAFVALAEGRAADDPTRAAHADAEHGGTHGQQTR